MVEKGLLDNLKNLGLVQYNDVFEDEMIPQINLIGWCIQRFYSRISHQDELAYHSMNVVAHKINVVAWLLIIKLCEEGLSNGLHQDLYDFIRSKKYVIPNAPNIAVILHGYARNYAERINTSHTRYLVNNPYFDIFIHAWTDLGHKYERQLEKVNPVDLISKYNPKGLKLDPIWDKLKSQFSLIGKLYPIFLKNSQDKADASQYVNASLYSIKAAYTLMQTYETQHNFIYNGILKWNFDTDVTFIDMYGMWTDMNKDVIWFRDGCSECDKESLIPYAIKKHAKHRNDIDTSWFYGERFYMAKALSLYDDAFDIADKYQSTNIENISNVPHKQQLDFIYIYDDKHINYNNNTRILCYHPHTLMTEHLKNFFCKTTKNLQGEIVQPAVFFNNL
jgi:hypothetical protein